MLWETMGVDGWIILKEILKELGGRIWIRVTCPRSKFYRTR